MHQNAPRSEKENFRRELVVMDILKGVFNVAATAVFYLQDFTTVGFMDLTFFNLTDCVSFIKAWGRKKHKLLEGLCLHTLFAQDYLHLHLFIWQTLLSKATYNWGIVVFLYRKKDGYYMAPNVGWLD